MVTPDLSALAAGFATFGGQIFQDTVNDFDMANQGILVYKNVKAPIFLPKATVTGQPRPYREQDDQTNPVSVADRTLTVHQSKWDFDVDPERKRNTYLAQYKPGDEAFADWIIKSVSNEYLADINDSTAWSGVYNPAGVTAADIADGWGTILAAEILATSITPVATGVITEANAVAKVRQVVAALPARYRKRGIRVYVSYDVWDKYGVNYGNLYPYQFNPTEYLTFKVNNINTTIQAASWLGNSQRIIATLDNNLVMGTDSDGIEVYSSLRRNIIEVRLMMPVGFQIADTSAIRVNDQA